MVLALSVLARGLGDHDSRDVSIFVCFARMKRRTLRRRIIETDRLT